MKNNVKNLIEFIDHSPSCFHVIENARKQFLEHGFMELKEMWLCQFDISVIFFYYASTFPSGNAALNTKRTTGPAMIN